MDTPYLDLSDSPHASANKYAKGGSVCFLLSPVPLSVAPESEIRGGTGESGNYVWLVGRLLIASAVRVCQVGRERDHGGRRCNVAPVLTDSFCQLRGTYHIQHHAQIMK